MNKNSFYIIFLIILVGLVLFFPFLGSVRLFDWDEVNFAEASREMIVTGDYLTVRIDYEPFHEKQPLFFWLQALSMQVFGVNEFSARFPNAIVGTITLIVIFLIGRNIYDYKFGILWVASYIGSFLPNFYFRTGLIDPTFNLFIFLGSFFAFKYIVVLKQENKEKINFIIFSGFFISLSIMTKGPVGFLIPTVAWLIYWLIYRKTLKFPTKGLIIYTLISFIPIIAWYGVILLLNGWDLLFENLKYQIRLLTTNDAGFSGPIYYHFLVVLFGCFPASVFALPSFRKNQNDDILQNNFRVWLITLLGTVLVIFSLVQTKIVHYSSLAYLPLTFLSAHYTYHLISKRESLKIWQKILFLAIGLIWSLLMIIIPIIGLNAETIALSSSDIFTQEVLRSNISWNFTEIAFGIIYFILLITSLIAFLKKKNIIGFTVITSSTALVVFVYLLFILPKIEEYIQGAPIEFIKSLKDKDCYIELLDVPNLKYSHYFYSNKPPKLSKYFNNSIPKSNYSEWLLTGNINHPAYFITKITEVDKYKEKYPDLNCLYTKNGYAFLVRYPPLNL